MCRLRRNELNAWCVFYPSRVSQIPITFDLLEARGGETAQIVHATVDVVSNYQDDLFRMTDKLRLAILFGGQSSEHEVSVVSARSMLAAMAVDRYELTLIGIARDGSWWTGPEESLLGGSVIDGSGAECERVTLDFTDSGILRNVSGGHSTRVDCFFPLLHGPCGEDGTIQGVLELANVAYVGCGVAASAVGMDKSLTKKVLQTYGLPQVECVVIDYVEWQNDSDYSIKSVTNTLSFPVFVKPANMGSSVGVTRANSEESLQDALATAFCYDNRALVEMAVSGCRELECSVLGNHDIKASVVGEVIPGSDFYDYNTKYVDDRSTLAIPAAIDSALMTQLQGMAITTFSAIGGTGLARVDFFLSDDDQIFVNEINTMPGFTPISMYPKLWSASGLEYASLVDQLVTLAIERHAFASRLQNTR